MFRKSTVDRAIRRKFAITLKDNEGEFAGILTETSRETLTFEQCETIPTDASGPQAIKGRVHVFVANIAYVQEFS